MSGSIRVGLRCLARLLKKPLIFPCTVRVKIWEVGDTVKVDYYNGKKWVVLETSYSLPSSEDYTKTWNVDIVTADVEDFILRFTELQDNPFDWRLYCGELRDEDNNLYNIADVVTVGLTAYPYPHDPTQAHGACNHTYAGFSDIDADDELKMYFSGE